MGEETGGPGGAPTIAPTIAPARPRLICKYSYKDTAPYLVIVQAKDPNTNVGNLHPMAIGRLLRIHNIVGAEKTVRKGKNRVGVYFSTPASANSFLEHRILESKGLEAYIPASLVTCKGIARGIELGTTNEDIINFSTNSLGVKILEAKRIQRRKISDQGETCFEDTQSVILTFAGKIIPKYIKIELFAATVHVYIPPVFICLNCLRYGHSSKQCRSQPRCPRCGEGHNEDVCEQQIKCVHCTQPHKATDRKCPEYERQKEIKKVMVTEDLSYYEARQKVPKTHSNTISEAPGFQGDYRDFPNTLSRKYNDLGISVTQRKLHLDQQKSPLTQKPQYSQALIGAKKRKPSTPTKVYDVDAHQACLFPSPSRTKSPSEGSLIHHMQGDELDADVTLTDVFKKYILSIGLPSVVQNQIFAQMELFESLQKEGTRSNTPQYEQSPIHGSQFVARSSMEH